MIYFSMKIPIPISCDYSTRDHIQHVTIQSRDYTCVVYCIYDVLEVIYDILESLLEKLTMRTVCHVSHSVQIVHNKTHDI